MTFEKSQSRNWFEQGASAYSRFRPGYPIELAKFLSAISPGRALAVDAGCGNGQLTSLLGTHFDKVMGLDPSADQIAHATAHPRITYGCAPAEKMPVPDHSADLITAAQAAHWFDLPRFYDEVRRIGVSSGILALVSYGVLRLDDDLNKRFTRFYWQEIGPYWPAERKLVDSGYADLPFPFEELSAPDLEIRKAWTLADFLGYIATWSAVRCVREAAHEDILERFAEDMAALWGNPSRRRDVRWPINTRLGRL